MEWWGVIRDRKACSIWNSDQVRGKGDGPANIDSVTSFREMKV